MQNTTVGDSVGCNLGVDESGVGGAARTIDLDGDIVVNTEGDTVPDVNAYGTCATNGLQPVTAGVHEVAFTLGSVDTGIAVLSGALNVLFVPFGEVVGF